ncbi:hypothetical protein ABEB36_007143 [Hypothenemus hampei]|uniref:ATPase AAA-type core domain-containing protein n=1 Tax=Hypothenemus hampei TaxID=57062 RepID=A0ABD1ET32_HYPHA
MSFEYYTTWWIKSKKNLEDLNNRDEAIRKKFKPINDRNLANNLIGGLYTKYSMLVQDLCACVDQMAHPQKRLSVKKLVDSACIRLNELNVELRKISLSEFHYIDGSLVELKLVPYDIEILHPCLFHHRPVDVEDLVQRVKNGEKIFEPPHLTEVLGQSKLQIDIPGPRSVIFTVESTKLEGNAETQNTNEEKRPEDKPVEEDQDDAENKSKKKRTKPKPQKSQVLVIEPEFIPEEVRKETEIEERLIQALKCIQTAERARQARTYCLEVNIRVERNKALRQAVAKKDEKPSILEITNKEAVQIQKIWKGYREREDLKFRERQRRLLIGMTEPSWRSTKDFEIFEANLQKRRDYRDERIREYIQAMRSEKTRIFRVVAPGLLEDIEDEIREWFHRWYIEAKTFDKYPPEEKGGTILVVRGETMTPLEYLEEYERKRREKVKAGGQAKLKAKKEKERKQKLEAEKRKKEAEKKRKEAEAKKKKKKKKPGDFEFEYGNTMSKALRDLGEEEFKKIWNDRNDFDNPEEKHYMDIITEQFCYETQLEVRKQADELMRLELELLERALAKDKHKKYKKKKKKKKRKKKKKGKKDITKDRMLEDLFQELINNGVIRQYPNARLDEFLGDFSYKNTELRALDFDPPAAILDVRQAITLNCIQPLGVETMKKPRSVLIVGPRQSGIHLLANAIFNHTRCVLFDLSPEVTAQIYPGKKGMTMLIHLVTKLSKILQPSVIFFDKAERIFYKKVPKDEKEMDPKRVGKKLIKGIVKTIQPQDRVLVLGITHSPWLAQGGKLKKAFDKFILIPRPDYGSVFSWWRNLLRPYHGIDRDFNFTSLATVTICQPYPVIQHIVNSVLTPRRIIQLKYKPLTQQELFEPFVSGQLDPVTDKEWKKYQKWYKRTPLGKERAVFNKWADSKREQEKQQQEKQQQRKR